ncbi:MAG: VOC family protein [Cyanobacteria bacterium P01_H01_bin.130]
MKTGLVLYASSISNLLDFYTHVFGFEIMERESTYSLLTEGEFELVLLETEISKGSKISYEPREATPFKPTFFIESPLEFISKKIKDKGGSVYSPKNWEFGGRQVCDAYDCEGNIFQMRVRKTA